MSEHGTHAGNVSARFMQGMRWSAAGISLVILYGLELPKLMADWDSYQSPAVQVAAMIVFTAVPLVAWRDDVVQRWRWPLISIVLLASIAATLTVAPVERLGTAHWSDEVVGWSLVLLSMDRGMGLFLGLLAAHYGPAYLLALFDGPVEVTFAGVVNTTVVTSAFQVAVVLFASALRRVAMSVAH